MASSLSLISSGPDPKKIPSYTTDPQKIDASEGPQNMAMAQRPLSFIAAQLGSSLTPTAPSSLIPASDHVLSVLRRSLAEESQPADSLIRATAEAARLLTSANGVAVAFRAKGVILCRARSGELAPDLGSCVNANAGISGECLRTASILVCEDAYADPRADNDLCRKMGIRSIVVVPLRGPVGIAGILEVFSARLNAFGNREINSLRGLAEIAEAAYERERRAQQQATRAALRSAHRLPALLARAVDRENLPEINARDIQFSESDDSRPERFLWVLGVATVSLLLITGVWLSWRGPISELAELESTQTHSAASESAPPAKPITTPPKPQPGIVRGQGETMSSRIPQARTSGLNAAAGSKSFAGQAASNPEASGAEQLAVARKADSLSSTSNSPSATPPPMIKIHDRQDADTFPALLSYREPLPVMDAPVSRGVMQGELVRKVDPVYPAQARAQGISGPVVLEIRVSEDGKVRNVISASGNPVLVTAAMQAVRQWQYAPTLLDRHPIETTKQVTVVFKLP